MKSNRESMQDASSRAPLKFHGNFFASVSTGTLVAYLFFGFVALLQGAMADTTAEDARLREEAELKEIELNVARISDRGLNEGLAKLLVFSRKYLPTKSVKSDEADLHSIYLASLRVHWHFVSFKESNPSPQIAEARQAIKAVYGYVLPKIDWVEETPPEKRTKHSDVYARVIAYSESIKGKLSKMIADENVKTPIK